MPEEITYLDDNIKQDNSEITEIKPLEEKKEEEIVTKSKKVVLPDWNIEPPVEIQRGN